MAEAASPAATLAEQYDVETTADAAVAQQSPAAPASAAAPAPPQTFTHPAYLTRMASELGWTPEEIAVTPTDALGEVVARVQAHSRRMAGETQRQSQPEPNRPLSQQQFQPPPQQPLQDDFDLGETEQFAPEIANALKKVTSAFKKKVAALEGQVTELANFRDQTAAQQQRQKNFQIDAVINNLGPQYAAHFGKGPGHVVQANDPQAFDNRLALIHIADTLMKRGMDLEAAIKQAARVFPADTPVAETPPPPPALNQEQEEWLQGGSAKPTHRQPAPEPPGRARAEKSVARKLNELGITTPTTNGVQNNEPGFASSEDFPE